MRTRRGREYQSVRSAGTRTVCERPGRLAYAVRRRDRRARTLQVMIEEFVERTLHGPPFVPVALEAAARRTRRGEAEHTIASARGESADGRKSR